MSWTTISHSVTTGSNSIYAPYYDQPVIAVNGRYDILMTPAAYEMLGKPKYVTVLHDPSAHLFGLQSAAASGSQSFMAQVGYTQDPITKKRVPIKRGMVRVSCKAAKDLGWGQPNQIIIYRAAMTPTGVLTVDYRHRAEMVSAPVRHRSKNGKTRTE